VLLLLLIGIVKLVAGVCTSQSTTSDTLMRFYATGQNSELR